MPISADWQGNLRSLTFGAGTDWQIDEPGISGLGSPPPRSFDQERGNLPGDVGGSDVAARRILTIPLVGAFASPALALDGLESLKTAFADAVVDLALDLRLPGYPSTGRRYYGRPRGLDADLSRLRAGAIRVLASFHALDPFAYGDEVVEALAGSSPISNLGTAISDRYSLELVGSGTVTFANGSDEEPNLVLVGVAGTVILDGRARTIVDDAGNDLYGLLSPGSGWPVLVPGVNALTLSGAVGDLTYRPAYL